MVLIPQLFGDGLQTIEGVAELSLIQGLSPDRIRGRVNATLEVFSHGIAYPIGALAAAGVAGVIGVRGGIALGWAGMAASILLLVLSPLPGIRSVSDEGAIPAEEAHADLRRASPAGAPRPRRSRNGGSPRPSGPRRPRSSPTS